MYTSIGWASYNLASQLFAQNHQFVYDTGFLGNLNFFSYCQVANAAAVMYNAKTSVFNGDYANSSITGDFDNNTKIVVEKQSVKVNIKNNYLMPITLKVITCFPKGFAGIDPITDWNNAKAQYVNLVPTPAQLASPTDATALWDMPNKYHGFNTLYSMNTVEYKMSPGKSVSFIRNGKCGVYDMANSVQPGGTSTQYSNNVKGYNQWLMLIAIPELANAATASTNEVIREVTTLSPPPAGSGNLIMDYCYTACIRAPDETPTAQKHQVVSFNNWMPTRASTLTPAELASKPVAVYNTSG